MKKLTAAVATALTLAAVPAFAWEGHVQKCFDKVYVPPEFKARHILIKPAKQAYEYRGNNRVELVHYPAMYREERYQVSPGKWVLKEIACAPCPVCK